jgi:hypothetical protein
MAASEKTDTTARWRAADRDDLLRQHQQAVEGLQEKHRQASSAAEQKIVSHVEQHTAELEKWQLKREAWQGKETEYEAKLKAMATLLQVGS